MAIPYLDTALTIIFSGLFVSNIVGNSVICYTILQRKSLRIPMNILFVNLSIADITVALFMSPRFVFTRLFTHPTGNQGMLMCTFLTGGTLMWCGGVVSLCTLMSISIERYYAIVHPYSFKGRLSARKARGIILLSWLFGILWVIPQMLTRRYSQEKAFCVGDWSQPWHIKAYGFCWLLIAVIVPVCIMATIYPRIIKALWLSGNKTVEISQRVRMRSRKRLTKIIIAVTVIYCCCWLPATTFYCLAAFIPSLETGSVWHKIGILMVTLNSSINPVLYSYQSKQLKKHIRKTITKLLCGCACGVGKVSPTHVFSDDNEPTRRFFAEQSMLTRITVLH
jgi:hypothetical protein